MTRDDPTHVSPYLLGVQSGIHCLPHLTFYRVLHDGLEHLWREAHANIPCDLLLVHACSSLRG